MTTPDKDAVRLPGKKDAGEGLIAYGVILTVQKYRILDNDEIEHLTGYVQQCNVSGMSTEVLMHVAEKLAKDFKVESKFMCEESEQSTPMTPKR